MKVLVTSLLKPHCLVVSVQKGAFGFTQRHQWARGSPVVRRHWSSEAEDGQELAGASVTADQDRIMSRDARTEPTTTHVELESQSKMKFQGANQDPSHLQRVESEKSQRSVWGSGLQSVFLEGPWPRPESLMTFISVSVAAAIYFCPSSTCIRRGVGNTSASLGGSDHPGGSWEQN